MVATYRGLSWSLFLEVLHTSLLPVLNPQLDCFFNSALHIAFLHAKALVYFVPELFLQFVIKRES